MKSVTITVGDYDLKVINKIYDSIVENINFLFKQGLPQKWEDGLSALRIGIKLFFIP